jgi:hypothetical protein
VGIRWRKAKRASNRSSRFFRFRVATRRSSGCYIETEVVDSTVSQAKTNAGRFNVCFAAQEKANRNPLKT